MRRGTSLKKRFDEKTKKYLQENQGSFKQIAKEMVSLTLADDFLFCEIMSDTSLYAEMLRRIFHNLYVSDIKPVEA